MRGRPEGCPLSVKQWEAMQVLERGATYAEVIEPEEGPLTPAQKAYLRVFDRHLRAWAAGDDRAEVRTRRQMRWMLHGIYVEADRRFPDEAAENSRMAA